MTIRDFVAAVLAALVCTGACAAQYEYMGKTVELALPDGYCEFGNSPIESALLEIQRKNASPAGELAQLAGLCTEMKQIAAGERRNLTQWLQLLVLKSDGRRVLVKESRAPWVRKVAASFAAKPIDPDEINRKTKDHLAAQGVAVQVGSMTTVGATDDAVFALMHGSAQAGASISYTFIAGMAITTIAQMPLGVYAYATPEGNDQEVVRTAAAYLKALLAVN